MCVCVCVFHFRFQTPDLEVQLSDELAGSLRTLKVCVSAERHVRHTPGSHKRSNNNPVVLCSAARGQRTKGSLQELTEEEPDRTQREGEVRVFVAFFSFFSFFLMMIISDSRGKMTENSSDIFKMHF